MNISKFKLVGCYDDAPILIYEIKAGAYVFVDLRDENPNEDSIKVMCNWLSPMRMCDMGIVFFETSPYDNQARTLMNEHIDIIEQGYEKIKDWAKHNRDLIREMANVKKYAKPNEITYW